MPNSLSSRKGEGESKGNEKKGSEEEVREGGWKGK